MFTMPTINMVATGRNIMRLRELAGLSVKDLVVAVNMSFAFDKILSVLSTVALKPSSPLYFTSNCVCKRDFWRL